MSTPDPMDRTTRLGQAPSELMETVTFGYELERHSSLWHWLSIADMAHVVALGEAGILDQDLVHELLRGLYESHMDAMPPLDPSKGDLYTNRQAWLRERLGSVTGSIATGRARREATTLAWHLECRLRIEAAIDAIAKLVVTLLVLAEEHRSALMPDFTYLQHAHPTTLGHYLLTFAYPFRRDLDRLVAAMNGINQSPAGSGSVNGSRLPLDREALARSLEFDGLIVHTRDAMWAPDIALEVISPAMSAFVTIDRFAEELQIWSTTEFGFFEPADQHARTSVIMPQKKNPYGLAMLRGHAREALGRVVSVIATNLTPTGQPDNRIVAYADVPELIGRLTGAALLLAEHVKTGRFRIDRMSDAARDGHTSATEICDWLTLERGLSNGEAHAIVGRAVRLSIDRGGETFVVNDLLNAAKQLGMPEPDIDPAVLQSLQEPATIVGERRGRGSTADLDSMISDLHLSLDALPTPRYLDFEDRYLTAIRKKTGEWNRQ